MLRWYGSSWEQDLKAMLPHREAMQKTRLNARYFDCRGLGWPSWAAMLPHLEAMLAYLEGNVGPSWGYVGPSWGYVGPSWGLCCPILGLCWPILQPMFAHVDLSWATRSEKWEKMGIAKKHCKTQDILMVRGGRRQGRRALSPLERREGLRQGHGQRWARRAPGRI